MTGKDGRVGDGPAAKRRRSWRLVGLIGAMGAVAAGVALWTWWPAGSSGRADWRDPVVIATGERVYAARCGSCHGDRLQGQPRWRERQANSRLPAPPHDAAGHTWHHPDQVLFQLVQRGLTPPLAPAGYESDMPAFGSILTDSEIWAVLAFIKSRWPAEIREPQQRMTDQAGR